MAYNPRRIWAQNFETEEREVSPQKVQTELSLISQETNILQAQINLLKVAGTVTSTEINQTTTNFSRHFLFLGA